MAQLYFKYGAMGSSKTANALMTRFNYEERGQKTLLVKPRLDTRDGVSGSSQRRRLMRRYTALPRTGKSCTSISGKKPLECI